MGRGFIWTDAKRTAVELEHEGRLSQREIAARLGVTRRTIEGWCRRPAFRARLQGLGDALREQFEREWQAKRAAMCAEAEARATFDVNAWLQWNTACHAARKAHRKLPPKPPGID